MALAVAKSIVLPGVSAPVRVSTGFGATKTATANPYADVPQPYQVSGSSSYATVMLFRNPFRSYVYYDPNTANHDSQYNAVGVSPLTSIWPGATFRFNPFFWSVDPAQTYQPHGQTLYCANGDARIFTWIDGGCSVTFKVASAAVLVSTVVCNVLYFDGQSSQQWFSFAVPATSIDSTFTITPGGSNGAYLAFEFTGLDTANQSDISEAFISGYNSTSGVWSHNALPQLDDNRMTTKSLRVTGITATFRNTTAQSYLNGEAVVALQTKGTNPQDIIEQNLPSQTFKPLSAIQNSTVRSFKKSFYTFLPPLEYEDLEFQNVNFGIINNIGCPAYPIVPTSSWLVCTLTVAAPADGIPATGSQFRIETSIEFCTQDTWKAIRPPDTTEDDSEKACRAVSRIPFVFADPSANLASDVNQLLSM